MIFMTGATGFIGKRLLQALQAKGEACICTNHDSDSGDLPVYPNVSWINSDEESIRWAFANQPIQGVIHLATAYGRSQECGLFDVMEANVDFPLKVLRYAHEHGCSFFLNTDSFFCRQMDGAWREGEIVYVNNYTKSKYIFRNLVRENIQTLNLAFLNVELQHVYGTGDDQGKFVTSMRDQLRRNVDRIRLTDGTQTRDWIYVDDVISAYLAILDHREMFQRGEYCHIEVGTGIETSVRDFCNLMKASCGASTVLEFGALERNRYELNHSAADNSMLRGLGWEPTVDIREGIRRLLAE